MYNCTCSFKEDHMIFILFLMVNMFFFFMYLTCVAPFSYCKQNEIHLTLIKSYLYMYFAVKSRVIWGSHSIWKIKCELSLLAGKKIDSEKITE